MQGAGISSSTAEASYWLFACSLTQQSAFGPKILQAEGEEYQVWRSNAKTNNVSPCVLIHTKINEMFYCSLLSILHPSQRERKATFVMTLEVVPEHIKGSNWWRWFLCSAFCPHAPKIANGDLLHFICSGPQEAICDESVSPKRLCSNQREKREDRGDDWISTSTKHTHTREKEFSGVT